MDLTMGDVNSQATWETVRVAILQGLTDLHVFHYNEALAV